MISPRQAASDITRLYEGQFDRRRAVNAVKSRWYGYAVVIVDASMLLATSHSGSTTSQKSHHTSIKTFVALLANYSLDM